MKDIKSSQVATTQECMQLLADLKAMNIGASGTVQLNRLQMNKNLTKDINKLGDHEILYLKGPDSLLLSAWKDRKTVLLLSNYHEPYEEERERKLRKKDYTETTEPGEKKIIPIPKAIVDYTYFMGGVDNFDQKSSNYSIQLRSHRWYIKTFFHFLEIALINSYIIYTRVCQKKNVGKILSHLDFRKEIIRKLVGGIRSQKQIESTNKKVVKKKSLLSKFQNNLITIKKQLIFPTDSAHSTEKKSIIRNSSQNRNGLNKRKSNTNLKLELEKEIEMCKIQEIPKDSKKKDS